MHKDFNYALTDYEHTMQTVLCWNLPISLLCICNFFCTHMSSKG